MMVRIGGMIGNDNFNGWWWVGGGDGSRRRRRHGVVMIHIAINIIIRYRSTIRLMWSIGMVVHCCCWMCCCVGWMLDVGWTEEH